MISAQALHERWNFPSPEYYEFTEHLRNEITQLAAHLDAATYQLLKLIGELDENNGWSGEGILSCAHWMNLYCGISIGAAREKVRVARALPELPKISDAFREGRVSYSKVRAATAVADSRAVRRCVSLNTQITWSRSDST